jgi:hypothetical protein
MTLRLNGATSGYTEIDAPAVAGSNTLLLPGGNGSSGQVLTTNGSGVLSWSNRPILQVVSATKVDTFTTSSTSDVEITGLTVSITPATTTNKILVLVSIGACGTTTNDYGAFFSLYRSASVISGAIGTAAGSRKVCSSAVRSSNSARYTGASISYLDSPNSTSSLTYSTYVSMESGGGTAVVNRNGSDGDQANFPRSISTITILEVAA